MGRHEREPAPHTTASTAAKDQNTQQEDISTSRPQQTANGKDRWNGNVQLPSKNASLYFCARVTTRKRASSTVRGRRRRVARIATDEQRAKGRSTQDGNTKASSTSAPPLTAASMTPVSCIDSGPVGGDGSVEFCAVGGTQRWQMQGEQAAR